MSENVRNPLGYVPTPSEYTKIDIIHQAGSETDWQGVAPTPWSLASDSGRSLYRDCATKSCVPALSLNVVCDTRAQPWSTTSHGPVRVWCTGVLAVPSFALVRPLQSATRSSSWEGGSCHLTTIHQEPDLAIVGAGARPMATLLPRMIVLLSHSSSRRSTGILQHS